MIIKAPKVSVPIKYVEPMLIRVDDLVPHEELVEGRLRDLIDKIVGEKAVDIPIIVAPIPGTRKYVILDGHHRWAALRELGCRLAPCIVIDYFSDEVKLKTWYPAIVGSINTLLRELRSRKLIVTECEYGARQIGTDILESYAFIVVGSRRECYGISGGIREQRVVSRILSDLNMKGILTLVYYGELEDAISDLEEKKISYLFLRRPVTKRDVLEVVRRREMYAPKTTRHILPFIPAKTYTPLHRLL